MTSQTTRLPQAGDRPGKHSTVRCQPRASTGAREEVLRFVLKGVTRKRIRLPESGVEIALLDWGGEGPPVLLHHANGFCAALWQPVVERLRSHFRLIAMDARSQGDSSGPERPEAPDAFYWEALVSDLISVGESLLDELGVERFALGIGHSFGGTLTLAAASRRDLYERIVLVDPVLYPKQVPLSARAGIELSTRARKRRAIWGSRSEAREFFLSKPLFSAWRPDALDLYVAEGLRERPDGQVELKCAPEVEARVFESPPTLDIAEAASQVAIPAKLIWASRGNFPLSAFEEIASRMRAGIVEQMDATHLVPMEAPDRVADSVLRFCTPPPPSPSSPGSSDS